jgi:hypothetical protein
MFVRICYLLDVRDKQNFPTMTFIFKFSKPFAVGDGCDRSVTDRDHDIE